MKALYLNVTTAYRALPPPVRQALRIAGSFLAGLAAAVIVSYVLYRVALPSKPFIYVAF